MKRLIVHLTRSRSAAANSVRYGSYKESRAVSDSFMGTSSSYIVTDGNAVRHRRTKEHAAELPRDRRAGGGFAGEV
ncbi:hypothetical protein EVAR_39222_1 [Eumeta japonica]|uniref:Uncharacterized protein n=1 Tax=Eumeta variegata TaxID=151549 RepID=A0A4C1VQ54_EUMVA|nr:hypothetical protein EVAR_39222_1 [Eumeta japonica]